MCRLEKELLNDSKYEDNVTKKYRYKYNYVIQSCLKIQPRDPEFERNQRAEDLNFKKINQRPN